MCGPDLAFVKINGGWRENRKPIFKKSIQYIGVARGPGPAEWGNGEFRGAPFLIPLFASQPVFFNLPAAVTLVPQQTISTVDSKLPLNPEEYPVIPNSPDNNEQGAFDF